MYIRSESFGNTEQKKETHSIPHFSCSLHCCLPCKWLVSAKYLSDKRVHGKSDIVAVKKPDVSTNQTLLILSEKKQIAIQGKESKLHYNQQGKLNVNSQTINQETENDKKKILIIN